MYLEKIAETKKKILSPSQLNFTIHVYLFIYFKYLGATRFCHTNNVFNAAKICWVQKQVNSTELRLTIRVKCSSD